MTELTDVVATPDDHCSYCGYHPYFRTRGWVLRDGGKLLLCPKCIVDFKAEAVIDALSTRQHRPPISVGRGVESPIIYPSTTTTRKR